MGLPARRLDEPGRGAGRGTARLRLVRAPLATPPQAASARAEAACKSAFNLAVVVLLALTVFGLARVALSAKVAEASIDATRLAKTIKQEKLEADRLELDKSMLVTPSRIESIAAGALKMTKAAPARYLAMPASTKREGDADEQLRPTQARTRTAAPSEGEPRERTGARRAAADGLVHAALDVTEKEARALLVGDVGLSSPE